MSLTKCKRVKVPPSKEDSTESGNEEEKPNVLHYSLSNKKYINMGWTVLPAHKFMKKEKIYLPIDQKNSNDWICNNESKTVLTYKNGKKLAEFKQKSISRIYYKDGKTAIDINHFEMKGYKFQRYVLRNDENDSLLAIFDTLGRGAVVDEFGKTRIKFNQLEGILLDTTVGTPRTWKWHHDCEKPEYENVMFDTFVQPPDDDITQIIKREIERSGDADLGRCKVNECETANAHQSDKISTIPDRETNVSKVRLKPTVQVVKNRWTKSKLTVLGERIPNKSNKQIKGNVSTIIDERTNSKHSMNCSDVTIYKNLKVFHQQQIKPMTLKLNKYLTMKIISRKNMYVTFLHDCWMMKIDLGIELTNECIESYLIEPEFASTDYEVVLSKINNFIQVKNKKKTPRTKKLSHLGE